MFACLKLFQHEAVFANTGENTDCKCVMLALDLCTQEGPRHDLPLMSPSGLVTLDLCVVSGTGHLPWLPLCQIPHSAVCCAWSPSFPPAKAWLVAALYSAGVS